MWHDLPNAHRPIHCHYQQDGYQTIQRAHIHYHHHHDYAHFSHAHDHCFQGAVEIPTVGYEYGQPNGDYANQTCTGNCYSRWPERENHVNFDSSSSCCHPLPATSLSPNFPSETETEKIRLFKEKISQECEHLLSYGECDECTVRDEEGEKQTIPISDLVDIVLKTVQSVKEEPGDTVVLSKKRQQNKMAAAKYRDRQKARWQKTKEEQDMLEKRNSDLRNSVESLQREVDDMKKKLLLNV